MRSGMRWVAMAITAATLAATAGCGNSGSSRSLSSDKVPPTFGGAVSATAIHDTQILVQWLAASDNRTPASSIAYHVYAATTPGGQDFLSPAATTGVGELRAVLTGLTPGTTYYVVVRAEDLAGNEDSNTTEVSAQTLIAPDILAPAFAGAAGATALSSSSIEVTWAAATDDNTPQAFIVYHAYASLTPGGQAFGVPGATSDPGATTMTVGSLQPTSTYYIVVRAEDLVGNEDTNTVEVTATTLTPDLTPPTFGGVTSAVSNNPTRVDLAWNAATDNQASPAQIVYRVYWATVPGGQAFGNPSAVTAAGATTYQATGLTPNTDYFFVVRAMDPSGNEDSNMVEIGERTLVSFGGNVLGIFTSNCAVSSCHSSSTPVLGQDLSNYSTIFNTAINQPAQQPNSPPMDRIEPFDSSLSYLQHKIDGTHLSVGGSDDQMPKNNPPLPMADRETIREWIDQGAQDN